jgi:hypothetical protein
LDPGSARIDQEAMRPIPSPVHGGQEFAAGAILIIAVIALFWNSPGDFSFSLLPSHFVSSVFR